MDPARFKLPCKVSKRISRQLDIHGLGYRRQTTDRGPTSLLTLLFRRCSSLCRDGRILACLYG